MYDKLCKKNHQLNELLEKVCGFGFEDSHDMAHNVSEFQNIAFRINTIMMSKMLQPLEALRAKINKHLTIL